MDDQAHLQTNQYAQDLSLSYIIPGYQEFLDPYPHSHFPYPDTLPTIPEGADPNVNERAPTELESEIYPNSYYPHNPIHIDNLLSNYTGGPSSATDGHPGLYPPIGDFEHHELSHPLDLAGISPIPGSDPFPDFQGFTFTPPRLPSREATPPLVYTIINDYLLQMPPASQRLDQSGDTDMAEGPSAYQQPNVQATPESDADIGILTTAAFHQSQQDQNNTEQPPPTSTVVVAKPAIEWANQEMPEYLGIARLLLGLRDLPTPAAAISPKVDSKSVIKTPSLPVPPARRKPGPKPKPKNLLSKIKIPKLPVSNGRASTPLRLREQEEIKDIIKAEAIIKRRRSAISTIETTRPRSPTPPTSLPVPCPRRTYRRTQVTFAPETNIRVFDINAPIIDRPNNSSPLSLPASPKLPSMSISDPEISSEDAGPSAISGYIPRPESPARCRMTRAAAARSLQRDLKAVEEATKYQDSMPKPCASDTYSPGEIPGLGLLGEATGKAEETSQVEHSHHYLPSEEWRHKRWRDVTAFWAESEHIDIPISDLRSTPLWVDYYIPQADVSLVEMRKTSDEQLGAEMEFINYE